MSGEGEKAERERGEGKKREEAKERKKKRRKGEYFNLGALGSSPSRKCGGAITTPVGRGYQDDNRARKS